MPNQYAYKSILPDGFDFPEGTRTATLLDGMSVGMGFVRPVAKTASAVETYVKALKPEKDHSYVHLISVGAQEFYGPNKRGDSFNEGSRVYCPPEPYCPEAREVVLEGGLKEFHDPTFIANGKVYEEHRSIIADPSNKPKGEVVFAVYNEPMHRGELIVRLPNREWSRDLDRLAHDKPLFFSMGCLTATDVCSVCGKRTSPADSQSRCDHLKNDLLSYMEDGTQVHAITDHPIFYDISRVANPADKIAFSLAKVASATGSRQETVFQPATLSAALVDRLRGRRADRVSLVCKAAAEEKCVIGTDGLLPVALPDEEEGRLLDSLSKDTPRVIFLLNKHRTVLPYPQFLRMAGGCDDSLNPAMPLIGNALAGIFGQLAKDPQLSGFVDDGTYEGEETADQALLRRIAPLIARYSLEEQPRMNRTIHVIMMPVKQASERRLFTPSAGLLAAKLAREYARYQLSFMTENPDPQSVRLTLANNHGNVQV